MHSAQVSLNSAAAYNGVSAFTATSRGTASPAPLGGASSVDLGSSPGKNGGFSMGKSWENHGKIMGKSTINRCVQGKIIDKVEDL